MKNGKIGVTTENIFPVIKKFLYSDHEIFLRELISNSVDATQKLKALASMGDVKGDLGDLTIRVSADKDAKTLTVTDRGIGMTADEVERYINQIAFSSAEEFMEKYKNQAIIGHFGLGFYSAFMVADKVEIFTRSYKEGAKTVHWSCEGSPEYEMEETTEQRDRGTTIVLHLSADTLEYGEDSKVEELLRKYCRFLPVPIAFGKVKEWKDGKYVDTNKDNIINNIAPLWTVKPTEITAEQYKEFYHELYPIGEEPLFSIHLNIDYPFHLTGILYFPKIRNNFEIQKNKIQLYSNQVYVTDQVEGIVPEYLTLLHGVIDSPDIPLNVSRSYLQSDSNVKKISNYITRKVADRLQELFTTMRADYEQKWDDLKIFIEYGIITDEKFAEKAESFMLWKTTEGKYFTAEEYKEVVKGNQTDKNGTVVFLYVDDPVEKNSFLESAKAKGYDVLVMDGQLDNHYVNWYESKHKDARFVRVDSDVIDKLIQKDETLKMSLSEAQQEIMRPVFESQMPKDEKIHYNISFEAMAADAAPVVITQNEFMRRMKEMAAISGGGMSQFYSQMPDNFTIAVNGNNPIVIDILADVEKSYGDKLKTITKKIDAAVAASFRRSGQRQERGGTHARGEIDARGAFEEDRHPARRARYAPARNRRREQARQTDHRPGIALQRITQGQKPDGVHPTQYLTDREIAVNYRISKRRLLFGAAAILYRIKSYGTPIRGSPSTKIRNIFLLGKTEMIDWRFVKKQRELQVFFQQLHKSFRSPAGTPRIAVDETQNRRTRIEQLARFVVNFVFERNTRFRQLPEGNSNRDQFVVMSRTQVLGVYFENRHHHAVLLLHIGIRRAETAEQLRTGCFVIADVIRMVYDTHLIGILIPDSEFEISCQHGVKTRLVYGPTAFFPPSSIIPEYLWRLSEAHRAYLRSARDIHPEAEAA